MHPLEHANRLRLIGASGTNSTLDSTDAHTAALELEQPLYVGGAISSGLAYTRTNKEIGKQNLYSARQDYVYDLINGYLTAAEKQLNLDLTRDNRNVLKKYFEITSQYAAIGRSKGVDRLQAQSNYNLSEAEVLKAESEYETQMQALYRLLGKPRDINAQLDTEIALQPIETARSKRCTSAHWRTILRFVLPSPRSTRQKYLNDTTMSVHKPTLSLKGSWGYDSPDRTTLTESRSETYAVSLNLKVPIFSGLSSFNQRSINAQDLTVREKSLAIRQRELHNSLSQAVSTLNREFRTIEADARFSHNLAQSDGRRDSRLPQWPSLKHRCFKYSAHPL